MFYICDSLVSVFHNKLLLKQKRYHNKYGLFTIELNRQNFYCSKSLKKSSTTNTLFLFNSADILDEVNDLIGITPLIVVPGNELYKLLVKHDAGVSVKD